MMKLAELPPGASGSGRLQPNDLMILDRVRFGQKPAAPPPVPTSAASIAGDGLRPYVLGLPAACKTS